MPVYIVASVVVSLLSLLPLILLSLSLLFALVISLLLSLYLHYFFVLPFLNVLYYQSLSQKLNLVRFVPWTTLYLALQECNLIWLSKRNLYKEVLWTDKGNSRNIFTLKMLLVFPLITIYIYIYRVISCYYFRKIGGSSWTPAGMTFHIKSQIWWINKLKKVVRFAKFAVYHTHPATYFHTF